MLTFRSYQTADFNELKTMIFELYADDKATTVGSMSVENVVKTIERLQKSPSELEIVVFTIQDQIVGYALLTWFWSNEFGGRMLMIDELLVKESFRNQGIASRFFDHLFSEKRYGEVGYLLEVGTAKKKTAAFYERMGFQGFNTKHLFRLDD
jgi:predicted N-acetyltransferase YhbS